MTQWDFQNKGTRISPARLSFVLEVPLRHLRPSVIYSVPYGRILQRAHSPHSRVTLNQFLLFPSSRVQTLLARACSQLASLPCTFTIYPRAAAITFNGLRDGLLLQGLKRQNNFSCKHDILFAGRWKKCFQRCIKKFAQQNVSYPLPPPPPDILSLHPCPIHPHRLESSKSTDDSTYRKSSRRRKRISCLPKVKLMDVGVYKMLTTRNDSIGSSRLVPTRVDSTRWNSIGSNSTQVTKKTWANPSMVQDILCITRSINVCKQMISFKRFFRARCESL